MPEWNLWIVIKTPLGTFLKDQILGDKVDIQSVMRIINKGVSNLNDCIDLTLKCCMQTLHQSWLNDSSSWDWRSG